MFLRMILAGVGLAVIVLRPTVGRSLLKQVVKTGMNLVEAGRQQTEKIKEDVQDLIAEIEHESKVDQQEPSASTEHHSRKQSPAKRG